MSPIVFMWDDISPSPFVVVGNLTSLYEMTYCDLWDNLRLMKLYKHKLKEAGIQRMYGFIGIY